MRRLLIAVGLLLYGAVVVLAAPSPCSLDGLMLAQGTEKPWWQKTPEERIQGGQVGRHNSPSPRFRPLTEPLLRTTRNRRFLPASAAT